LDKIKELKKKATPSIVAADKLDFKNNYER
jgi:hypothetical protein